jgi:hypothetical protein
MLGRQAVDRHDYFQFVELRPFDRDWPHSAGHELSSNSSRIQLRQNLIEFTESDQWLTAYDGNMQGLVTIDQLHKPVNKLLTFEVANLIE